MFFMRQQEKLDIFDYVQHMVRELVLHECPEHKSQHHLLFTLNLQKHKFTEQLEQLQTMNLTFPSFQQLAIETRQHIHSKISLFEHLEKAYLLTQDTTQRQQIIHSLSFDKEKIEQLYHFYSTQKEVYTMLDRQSAFYNAVKQELMPILSKLYY